MYQSVSARTDMPNPPVEPASSASVPGNDVPASVDGCSPKTAINAPIALGVMTALSMALSACGGSSGAGSSTVSAASGISIRPTGGAVAAAAISDADAARFLLQAQFSASDSDIAAVKAKGYSAWLDAQFAGTPSQTAWAWLDSRGYNIADSSANYYNHNYCDNLAWRMLMTGDDQLRKRTALALSEMMVLSSDSVVNGWPYYFMAAYWDLLTTDTFGNFRTLLEDITLNAAMGNFLNMNRSVKENATTGAQPDENYAREIMQLFTIGLYQLNDDGSYKTDASGNRIETYTLSDVSNLARVFTGYLINMNTSPLSSVLWRVQTVATPQFTRERMVLTPKTHSTLAATFLGTTIPANTDGAAAFKTALDTLFNHQNLPPNFARQMIMRLVTSNPSPAYVGRVAAAFKDNGSGVRGDLKAVWKAILTDPEARTLSTDPLAGKLREPIVRLTQWARTFNATSTTGKWEIGNMMTAMGQSPGRSQSVFNFFRPGYVPPHTAIADKGQVAPEFQIHSESTTAGYINLMVGAIHDGIKDVKGDYSALASLGTADLVAWLNLHLTANQLSANSLAIMQKAVDGMNAATDKTTRIMAAVLLVMTCPEYMVQK